MHGTLRKNANEARESGRTSDRQDEQVFGACLSQVARTLWPSKTAAHIAAAAGCTERAAEFYLAGDREWSGDALAAIVSEILKRHAMRNVRVAARHIVTSKSRVSGS
jgi:hypothetical protein